MTIGDFCKRLLQQTYCGRWHPVLDQHFSAPLGWVSRFVRHKTRVLAPGCAFQFPVSSFQFRAFAGSAQLSVVLPNTFTKAKAWIVRPSLTYLDSKPVKGRLEKASSGSMCLSPWVWFRTSWITSA